MTGFVGEDIAEFALHVAEGVAVARPELAQAVVAREGSWHGDVTHVAVIGVDLDQCLYVSVLLQFPQRLDEFVCHFFGHGITSRLGTRRGYCPALRGGCKSALRSAGVPRSRPVLWCRRGRGRAAGRAPLWCRPRPCLRRPRRIPRACRRARAW